jgi:Bromodomain extra-terminal - transcription regulation
MTSAEKQQLGRMIQKLPEKAYDRLIEIFQSRNPFSRQNSDSVVIDLEKQVSFSPLSAGWILSG